LCIENGSLFSIVTVFFADLTFFLHESDKYIVGIDHLRKPFLWYHPHSVPSCDTARIFDTNVVACLIPTFEYSLQPEWDFSISNQVTLQKLHDKHFTHLCTDYGMAIRKKWEIRYLYEYELFARRAHKPELKALDRIDEKSMVDSDNLCVATFSRATQVADNPSVSFTAESSKPTNLDLLFEDLKRRIGPNAHFLEPNTSQMHFTWAQLQKFKSPKLKQNTPFKLHAFMKTCDIETSANMNLRIQLVRLIVTSSAIVLCGIPVQAIEFEENRAKLLRDLHQEHEQDLDLMDYSKTKKWVPTVHCSIVRFSPLTELATIQEIRKEYDRRVEDFGSIELKNRLSAYCTITMKPLDVWRASQNFFQAWHKKRAWSFIVITPGSLQTPNFLPEILQSIVDQNLTFYQIILCTDNTSVADMQNFKGLLLSAVANKPNVKFESYRISHTEYDVAVTSSAGYQQFIEYSSPDNEEYDEMKKARLDPTVDLVTEISLVLINVQTPKKAHITLKKNLAAQIAKYDNLCLTHDYIKLSPNWCASFSFTPDKESQNTKPDLSCGNYEIPKSVKGKKR
jgi:hypothetical protein